MKTVILRCLAGLMFSVILPARAEAQEQTIAWSWDPGHRSFHIESPEGGPINLQGVSGSVEIDGELFSLDKANPVSQAADFPRSVKANSNFVFKLSEKHCLWT